MYFIFKCKGESTQLRWLYCRFILTTDCINDEKVCRGADCCILLAEYLSARLFYLERMCFSNPGTSSDAVDMVIS